MNGARRSGTPELWVLQLIDMDRDSLQVLHDGLVSGEVAALGDLCGEPPYSAMLVAFASRLLAGRPLIDGPGDVHAPVLGRAARAEAHRMLAGVGTVAQLLDRIDGKTAAPHLVDPPAAREAHFATQAADRRPASPAASRPRRRGLTRLRPLRPRRSRR